MHSLEVLAKTTNKSITDIMEPHKEVLQDMIPPKKHLLRHQPANAQIGLMVMYLVLLSKSANMFISLLWGNYCVGENDLMKTK